MRIGVLREYMDKRLFTDADSESIDIVDRAVADLRKAGATIVDPGAGGALFQECIAKYAPSAANSLFVRQYPKLFPVDAAGKPTADHVALLVKMFADPALFPEGPSIRELAPAPTVGERKYAMNRYLAERGDASIKSIDDLIAKSQFFTDVRPTRVSPTRSKGSRTRTTISRSTSRRACRTASRYSRSGCSAWRCSTSTP